jgi:beta-galactosidase
MKVRSFLFVPFLLIASALSWFLPQSGETRAQAGAPPRERLSFNEEWRFSKGDPPDAAGLLSWDKVKAQVGETGNFLKRTATAGAARPAGADVGAGVSYIRPDFDDSAWRKLDLPHDWGIEGPFLQDLPGETGKRPWPGVGWYRKHFRVDAADSGRRLFLDIDGAMAYAMVWVNGRFLGGWPYGYTSFRIELTPGVRYGADNVIAVRLNNPPASSRWYPGSGIYRNVWLVKTAPVHVAQWGTHVSTPEVTPQSAKVIIEVTVDNQASTKAEVTARTDLYAPGPGGAPERRPVASAAAVLLKVDAGVSSTVRSEAVVSRPRLWSIEKPDLCLAVTTLTEGGEIIDRYQTTFGIRSIRFDPAGGFVLNGTRVPLNGVCNHHDLGALGTAINVRALERQIALLREMGANAIRTSHNPPAPELLDLCDRMGIVVMDEAFDCWRGGKNPNDYHLLFDDWHEKDLRALVRRDRNHPSVVLWSIGNEVPDQRTPQGPKIAAELAGIVHEEDSTRPVAAGCDDINAGYSGFQKSLDAFGYNYKPAEYRRFRAANPSIPLLGSETSSCVSSRGEYFFPVSNDKKDGRADFQVSSYDLYAPPWAWPPDVEWKGLDENPSVAGEFVWTGFDYLGEPTPYGGDSAAMLTFTNPATRAARESEFKKQGKISVPSRSSYFGILDLAGFKKDRFFIYQARWRPELPMAHVLPHWNWPERIGQVTPVHVYSSGDEVELFLNGKSLGRRKREALQYRFRWDDVKYEPGEVRAVAYKAGKKWAEDVVRTTGPAARLSLQPDRSALSADGHDLSFIAVTVADGAGVQVPRTNNLVRFEIEGPGEVVAVDNGDPTNHSSFQAREVKAFNGLCLLIVRLRRGATAALAVTARADGLESAQVVISVTKP